jgi:hypothetical protein
MVSGPTVVVCEVHLASRRVELLGSMLFNFEIPAKRDSNPPVRHDTPNQPPWVQVIGMSAESVLWGKLMLAIDRGDEQDVAELLKVGPCRLSRTTKVRLISPRLRSNRLNQGICQGMPAQPLPPVTPALDRPSASRCLDSESCLHDQVATTADLPLWMRASWATQPCTGQQPQAMRMWFNSCWPKATIQQICRAYQPQTT